MEKIIESKYVVWDILNSLGDKDLGAAFKTNLGFRQVMNDDTFWKLRADKYIDPLLIEKYHPTGNQTYKEFYMKFRRPWLPAVGSLFWSRKQIGVIRLDPPKSPREYVEVPTGYSLLEIALADKPYLYIEQEDRFTVVSFYSSFADAFARFFNGQIVREDRSIRNISKPELRQIMESCGHYIVEHEHIEVDDNGNDVWKTNNMEFFIVPAVLMPYNE